MLNRIPDFSAPFSPRLDSERGAALRPLIAALREVHLAEEAVNSICALIAVKAPHLIGSKTVPPETALEHALARVEAARDKLNDERLRITDADETSHCGTLDASNWAQVQSGLIWALEAVLDDDSGDYTESNRLTAGDVVSTGRAA